MPNYNKAVMIGHLTRDLDIRHTLSGATVGNTAIAVTRKFKVNNEPREETTFLDCTLWGKTAEICAEYAGKGSLILFEGYLKQDSWEDKETGNKRSKISLVVETMQFLASRNSGGGERPAKQETTSQASYSDSGGFEEEVPF